VIDAFSRKIVGWQLAPHMRPALTSSWCITQTGLPIHIDRLHPGTQRPRRPCLGGKRWRCV
jgi:hypothetical protein